MELTSSNAEVRWRRAEQSGRGAPGESPVTQSYHAVYVPVGGERWRLHAVFTNELDAQAQVQCLLAHGTPADVLNHPALTAIAPELHTDQVPLSEDDLLILVPRSGSRTAALIRPGSGIVGTIHDHHVLVHFEDHRFRSRDAGTWADRVGHAALRRRQRLSGTALGRYPRGELLVVGRQGGDQRIRLEDPQALAAYLGRPVETLEEELGSTGDGVRRVKKSLAHDPALPSKTDIADCLHQVADVWPTDGQTVDQLSLKAERLLDRMDEPTNTPCETCGRKDLPLHTDGECAECSPKGAARGPHATRHPGRGP